MEWQIFSYYTFARDVIPPWYVDLSTSLASYALLYVVFFIVESRFLPKDSDPARITVPSSNVFFAWIITGLIFALSNLSYVLSGIPFTASDSTDIFYIRTLSDIVGVVMGQMFHLEAIIPKA